MAGECRRQNGDGLSWRPSLVALLLMFCLPLGTSGNSCSILNKNGDSTTMQFTDPDRVRQHVSWQGYQAISCKAVNFCHIRWYRLLPTGERDPYPWVLGRSTKYSLEGHNQTLRFTAANEAAQGDYECDVFNSTHNITRKTELLVDESYWRSPPLQLQNNLCRNRTVEPGENVTLLCSFYAGDTLNFPPTVYWMRPNMSLPQDQNNSCGSGSWLLTRQLLHISSYMYTAYHSRPILMDKTKLANTSSSIPWVGNELQVINVSEEAYGLYCIIANNYGQWSHDILMLSPVLSSDLPNSYPAFAMAVVASSVIFVTMVFLTWKMMALDIKLWYQGYYGNIEQNDGKIYDAYISYSWSDDDRRFVLHVIMPYLEKFGYRLFVPEIHTVPSNVLLEELGRAMEASRRFIMLITPSYTTSETSKYEVDLATDMMSSKLSKHIIPVFLGVSPFSDPSPLYGSEPSLSSGSSSSSTPPSSLTADSQPSSLSSSDPGDVFYCSSAEASPDSLSSCSSACSKPVKIDFNFSPVLGQLIKVLRPLKTSRKEPFRLCNHTRFLKRLRLRMPRPPAGNEEVAPRRDIIMETMSQTSDLVNNEILPDRREEGMDFRMQTFPRLYPVVPNGDTQNGDVAWDV